MVEISCAKIAKQKQGRPVNPDSFYKRVGQAIIENETFDWEEDPAQWPNIKWCIARYMLENYSEWERHRLMESYVNKMSIDLSISYIENELGKPVFRGKSNGGNGRNLSFITIDPSYKQAKIREYSRITKRWEQITDTTKNGLNTRLPSETTKFISNGQKKLNEF